MQAYNKLFQTYRTCKKDIPDSHHELFIEKGEKFSNLKSLTQTTQLKPPNPNPKKPKRFLGYRPVPCSLSSALLSAFSPHNELINFWTHFLPGVEMIRQLWIRNYDFRDPREISMILFMVRLSFY